MKQSLAQNNELIGYTNYTSWRNDLDEINDLVNQKQLYLDKSLIHLRAELKQIHNEGYEKLSNNKAIIAEKEILVKELENAQSKTNYL